MGLFGRKKDFWDEVDRESVKEPGYDTLSEAEKAGAGREMDVIEDGRWHPTKSMPFKAVMRGLLFIAAVVMAVSGYSVYTYFSNGGSWSTEPDYYQSHYFGEEYNRNVVQLIHLVEAIEKRGEISEKELENANQELIKNYMSEVGNFSFAVYDEDDREVIVSDEDAVKRIEASHYFIKMDSSEGTFSLNTGVDNRAYEEGVWKDELTSLDNGYTIYAAVDNELTSKDDGFYKNYEQFKQLTSTFGIARIVLIAAAVIFIILLIFSIVATGNANGYAGIRLTWFDRVFTELAAIIIIALGGGALYGAYYMLGTEYSFRNIAVGAFLVLAYIFIIRGYFSLVRRIKAGTCIKNMLLYRLFDGLGRLSAVPRILLTILVLIVVNGALVLALFRLDFYEVFGIPLVYILVPVIFVLENICFISWVIRKGNSEYEDETEEEDGSFEEEVPENGLTDPSDSEDSRPTVNLGEDVTKALARGTVSASASDWEHMDLGASVDEAIQDGGEALAASSEESSDHTVILPKDELESLLGNSGLVRDSATSFDFIQLNKDIRKLHRSILKENGVAVTLRTPDKPIILEMNKEDMWKAISMIYDNLEQYTEADSRVYAEIYTQDNKLIYIVKNAVRPEAEEAAKAITAPGAELTGGLKTAKEIIEKNQGKLVVAMDGNIFKTGILLGMKRD